MLKLLCRYVRILNRKNTKTAVKTASKRGKNLKVLRDMKAKGVKLEQEAIRLDLESFEPD